MYAPVARMTTLRMVIAIGTMMGFEVHQMAIVTAFLYSTLDKEIYMIEPNGYEKGQPGQALLLKKGYWNDELKRTLKLEGFTQSSGIFYFISLRYCLCTWMI